MTSVAIGEGEAVLPGRGGGLISADSRGPERPETYRPGSMARWVSTAGILVSLAALAYGLAVHPPAPGTLPQMAVSHGLPLLVLATALALRRLPAERADTFALATCATVVGLYLGEAVLRLVDPAEASAHVEECRETEAERNCRLSLDRRLPFDTRSRLAVLDSLLTLDPEAVPAVHPKHMLHLLNRFPALPLGGISKALTIYCNETGEFVIYRSDAHGFRNPPGGFSADAQVALVGDSFTQGFCVDEAQSIAGIIRERYPATVNLGMNGVGPLFALAAIREYLPDLRPSTVLWLFYEGNDLRNLDEHRGVPPLLAYLEPEHRQGLTGMQPAIDRAWRAYVHVLRENAEISLAEREADRSGFRNHPALRFVLLSELRSKIAQLLASDGEIETPADWKLLRRTAIEARRTVASWGGRLLVVYLPTWSRFATPDQALPPRDSTLALFDEVGIEVLDATPAFARQPDPMALWPFGRYGHYTAEGYRVVAELILSELGTGDGIGH